MTVKLHRCPLTLLRADWHACWKVQKALEEQGISYEVVKHPVLRGRRDAVEPLRRRGHSPVIEYDDGKTYWADPEDMARRIASGGLLIGIRGR